MAEFVEAQIEETIPILEELERVGLLNDDETKKLIEARRQFEYKIIRNMRLKSDHYSYVMYECKLLDLIELRLKKHNITSIQPELKKKLFLGILRILRYMMRLWPSHQDVWELALKLTKANNWNQEVSNIYSTMTKKFSHGEAIWVEWARWEIEGRRRFSYARNVLLSQAAKHHPDSPIIYRELFRLELLFLDFMNREDILKVDSLDEAMVGKMKDVMNCGIARVIFDDACQKFSDPSLFIDLYMIAAKFEFSVNLREHIYEHLLSSHPTSPHVWKVRAQRAALGYKVKEANQNSGEDPALPKDITKEALEQEERLCSDPSEVQKVDPPEMEGTSSLRLTPVEKLNAFLSVMQEGLTTVGQSFLPHYIDELCCMLHALWGIPKLCKHIKMAIRHVFKASKPHLSPFHFQLWNVLLAQSSSEMKVMKRRLLMLKRAVILHPQCVPLKTEYLSLLVANSTPWTQVLNVFTHYLDADVQKFDAATWLLVIENIKNNAKKRKMFKKGIDYGSRSASLSLKVAYLEWILKTKDINACLDIYNQMSFQSPFCAKLHARMIRALLDEEPIQKEKVKNVFELAIQQFGKSHYGLWLCYGYYEKKCGSPLAVNCLWNRAELHLNSEAKAVLSLLRHEIQALTSKRSNNYENPEGNTLVVGDMEDKIVEADFIKEPVVQIVMNAPVLTHSQIAERRQFFVQLMQFRRICEEDAEVNEDDRVWEEVLCSLTGCEFPLRVQLRNSQRADKETGCAAPISVTVIQGKNKLHRLNDRLVVEGPEGHKYDAKSEIEKALEASEVLKPGFNSKLKLDPYYVSSRKAKALRKKEREKTKGPGWFNMKAPEMTEEVKRDLEVIQMRSVIDPKRHYKKNDMKELPKFFQIGKVMDSPIDFYSSRIPKSQRKRTIADEIMDDEEHLRYQKRKYKEAVAKREKHVFPSRRKCSKNASGNKSKKKKFK